METEVHYDGIEDFEMESKSNPFKSLENEETRAALHEMFLGMREAQRYIFLKRFLSGELEFNCADGELEIISTETRPGRKK